MNTTNNDANSAPVDAEVEFARLRYAANQCEGIGAAGIAMNIIEAVDKLSAAPAPVDGRNPLQAYADSYRQMARMGDGKVHCLRVAADIENNMIRQAAPAPGVGEAVAVITVMDWYPGNGPYPIRTDYTEAGSKLPTGTKLYTAPPAPVPMDASELFDPARLPERDADGRVTHPDFGRVVFVEDEIDVSPFFHAAGLEFKAVSYEWPDLGDEDDGIDLSWLTPEVPEGGGWRMVSIGDTEDGTAVVWWCRYVGQKAAMQAIAGHAVPGCNCGARAEGEADQTMHSHDCSIYSRADAPPAPHGDALYAETRDLVTAVIEAGRAGTDQLVRELASERVHHAMVLLQDRYFAIAAQAGEKSS